MGLHGFLCLLLILMIDLCKCTINSMHFLSITIFNHLQLNNETGTLLGCGGPLTLPMINFVFIYLLQVGYLPVDMKLIYHLLKVRERKKKPEKTKKNRRVW
jgi:hypothetical protein